MRGAVVLAMCFSWFVQSRVLSRTFQSSGHMSFPLLSIHHSALYCCWLKTVALSSGRRFCSLDYGGGFLEVPFSLFPYPLYILWPGRQIWSSMAPGKHLLAGTHHEKCWEHPPISLEENMICGGSIVGASLVAQMVKSLPEMQETQVQSLGWEDPLAKEMVTHSSILAWRAPRTEEPGGV